MLTKPNPARFDDSARKALTACVREIEKTTDAELVLVVRARSGSYRAADYLFGVVLALVGVAFLLFSPISFHPNWVLIDIVVLFVAGALISSRSNALRRLFTREQSRDAAVRTCAAAMFYEAGIANTDAETGVLIYVSLLERRLELIADRGVLKAVPAREWNQQMFALHQAGEKADAEVLRKGLNELGELLGKHLPATGENPNELPDLPRFEL
jgi:putative membrane protein